MDYQAVNDSLNVAEQSYTPLLWSVEKQREINQTKTGGSAIGRYIKIGNLMYFQAYIKTKIIESNEYAFVTLPLPAAHSTCPITVNVASTNLTDAQVGFAETYSTNSIFIKLTSLASGGAEAVHYVKSVNNTFQYISIGGVYVTT